MYAVNKHVKSVTLCGCGLRVCAQVERVEVQTMSLLGSSLVLLSLGSLVKVCWLHAEVNPLASLRHERASINFGEFIFRVSSQVRTK